VTYQVIELNGGHPVVDTGDDLHCDSSRVDMVRVEPVTQPRHAGCDLVELHAFLASIWCRFVSTMSTCRKSGSREQQIECDLPRLKTNMLNVQEVWVYGVSKVCRKCMQVQCCGRRGQKEVINALARKSTVSTRDAFVRNGSNLGK
jgi:hypothetical protein